MQDIRIKIVENSWIARIAAYNLNAKSGMAITIGNSIHLYQANREELIHNKAWFQHELAHVLQFQKFGFWCFLCKYLIESMKVGYHNNKYEVEARMHENMNFKKLRYRALIQ